jgi:rRNA-processing protein FCF1
VGLPITNKYTVERISNFSELNLEEESKMLISLFDALTSQHYYFLSEFEFTENIEWRPKQYDFLSKLNPYFDINKRRKEYKVFKELYNLVEDMFLNFTMPLRVNGLEPYELFAKRDKEFVELVESVSSLFKDNIAIAYSEADVIIGCGTFISMADFPIDLAFQYSSIDVGQYSYTSTQKPVTVNPFILYWLITSFFKYKKGTTIPSYVTVEIDNIPPTVQFLNVKELKIRTYNPSEIVSKVFISAEGAEFIEKYLKENVFSHNPIVQPGDFLTPFTSPSIVLEVNTEETEEDTPFVDPTPYGQLIYEQFGLPKIVDKTQFHVELFDNPLYNKNRPLILDTNVLDIGAFPYNRDSPFFKTFILGREVVIPSTVIYELKRKLQIGREKEKVIKALMRLQDYKSANSIKLTISGELSEEAATNELLMQLAIKENKSKNVKDAKRDIRDSMILLEAIRRNAVLFTNDKELRILAALLGVPSISYNSLFDDVSSIVSKVCRERHEKVDIKEIVKLVKDYASRVRGEKYRDEDITLVLGYLRQRRKEVNEFFK